MDLEVTQVDLSDVENRREERTPGGGREGISDLESREGPRTSTGFASELLIGLMMTQEEQVRERQSVSLGGTWSLWAECLWPSDYFVIPSSLHRQ